MPYRIEWTAPAERELRKLDRAVARRILVAVTKLGVEPRPHGARSLTGYPAGTTRIRVGDYRVVYVIDDGVVTVTVVRVARRRDVYRDL
jgi:mRNA interferase RelE/StbE